MCAFVCICVHVCACVCMCVHVCVCVCVCVYIVLVALPLLFLFSDVSYSSCSTFLLLVRFPSLRYPWGPAVNFPCVKESYIMFYCFSFFFVVRFFVPFLFV